MGTVEQAVVNAGDPYIDEEFEDDDDNDGDTDGDAAADEGVKKYGDNIVDEKVAVILEGSK